MKHTKEQIEEVIRYEPDTGKFYWLSKYSSNIKSNLEAGGTTDRKRINKYLSVTIYGQKYLLHRLAWFLFYGVLPDGPIDHINNDGKDNRIENLRLCTFRQNSENRCRGSSSTGFMGVYKLKTRFRAYIGFNGKKIYLGSFKTAEEASDAYKRKKEILHPFWNGKSEVIE